MDMETPEFLENTYTAKVGYLLTKIDILGVNDRESLYREVITKNSEDGSFTVVSYSVEDDRRGLKKGVERIDMLSCTVVREAGGSDGLRCV